MVEIPLQQLPSQELRVVLEGTLNCTLFLYWRDWRLYADLDVGAESVFRGCVCLNGQAVNQSPSAAFTGKLVFIDTQGSEHPRWEGLGDRWALLYLTKEECSGYPLVRDAVAAALEEAEGDA